MTTPPPERTSALRPLSEHGEGYCRVCHFIIGLDGDGRLERHTRGASMASTQLCKGSRKTPPRLTPHTSYRAAFRTDPPLAKCHVCLRTHGLLIDGRFGPHSALAPQTGSCPGSYHPARPENLIKVGTRSRNHSGERG